MSDQLLWTRDQGLTLTGCGAQALLDEPLTAFFSSRQCPGIAIRAAMDWALEQARGRRPAAQIPWDYEHSRNALEQPLNHQPVVSGFHSTLEQSVLAVLLQARCPVVAVLARPVVGARLPPEWAEPLAQGRMAVVSAAARSGRLTEALAAQRNEWVASLASQIVVAHARPGGRLAVLCDEWARAGRSVRRLG